MDLFGVGRKMKQFKEFELGKAEKFKLKKSKQRMYRRNVVHGKDSSPLLFSINLLDTFDKEAKIVDAGCGGNQYQMHFPNLIAFDFVDYGNQHFVSSILDADIDQESQDGVLCLGVLHECPDDYIQANMEKMLSWIKPGGKLVMRGKTQRETTTDFNQGYWSEEKIEKFSNKFNLSVVWNTTYQAVHGHTYMNTTYQADCGHTNMYQAQGPLGSLGYIWCWRKNV